MKQGGRRGTQACFTVLGSRLFSGLAADMAFGAVKAPLYLLQIVLFFFLKLSQMGFFYLQPKSPNYKIEVN